MTLTRKLLFVLAGAAGAAIALAGPAAAADGPTPFPSVVAQPNGEPMPVPAFVAQPSFSPGPFPAAADPSFGPGPFPAAVLTEISDDPGRNVVVPVPFPNIEAPSPTG